jgi:hypothetical protein
MNIMNIMDCRCTLSCHSFRPYLRAYSLRARLHTQSTLRLRCTLRGGLDRSSACTFCLLRASVGSSGNIRLCSFKILRMRTDVVRIMLDSISDGCAAHIRVRIVFPENTPIPGLCCSHITRLLSIPYKVYVCYGAKLHSSRSTFAIHFHQSFSQGKSLFPNALNHFWTSTV